MTDITKINWTLSGVLPYLRTIKQFSGVYIVQLVYSIRFFTSLQLYQGIVQTSYIGPEILDYLATAESSFGLYAEQYEELVALERRRDIIDITFLASMIIGGIVMYITLSYSNNTQSQQQTNQRMIEYDKETE